MKAQWFGQRDFFGDCTISLGTWLETPSPASDVTGVKKIQLFLEAWALVEADIQRKRGLRESPRVGYDPRADDYFFLFKADQGGDLVVVSRHGMAGAIE